MNIVIIILGNNEYTCSYNYYWMNFPYQCIAPILAQANMDATASGMVGM